MDAVTSGSWRRAVTFTGPLGFVCASGRSTPNRAPGIYSPSSEPYGRTYAHWSGDWLKWILSMPAGQSPLLDPGGRYWRLGESAPVFLLGSSARDAAVRCCTVPTGRSILLTPGSVFCLLDENAGNEEGLRACVEGALPLITNVAVEIDGSRLRDLHEHRVVSDLVNFALPDDNLFGLRAGRYRGIVGGYFLIHAPMAAGQHVVRLHDEVPDFDFVSDVTYLISVGAHH